MPAPGAVVGARANAMLAGALKEEEGSRLPPGATSKESLDMEYGVLIDSFENEPAGIALDDEGSVAAVRGDGGTIFGTAEVSCQKQRSWNVRVLSLNEDGQDGTWLAIGVTSVTKDLAPGRGPAFWALGRQTPGFAYQCGGRLLGEGGEQIRGRSYGRGDVVQVRFDGLKRLRFAVNGRDSGLPAVQLRAGTTLYRLAVFLCAPGCQVALEPTKAQAQHRGVCRVLERGIQSSLQSCVEAMRLDSASHDVSLVSQEDGIATGAHSFMLRAVSVVLRRKLDDPALEGEGSCKRIVLKNASAGAVSDFLDCIYRGGLPAGVEDSVDRLAGVMELAVNMKVESVHSACLGALLALLSASNTRQSVLRLLALSDVYGLQSYRAEGIETVVASLRDYMKYKPLEDLPLNVLLDILARRKAVKAAKLAASQAPQPERRRSRSR
mmetsp:Transcript_107107/g.239041  ORF Transcript_107107/g.239041 Transcript_107107/m.239041 type:complete len:437 (-) Transcript_107107:101-1411(-)